MKINEVINCDCLSNIFEIIQNNNKRELDIFLKKISFPKIEDEKFISFIDCKFNIVLLIYPEAKSNEIISGFDILNKYIPIDIYTSALFFQTFDTLLNQYRNKIEVANDMIVDNLIEPEIIELLRLSYWINKCENTMDKQNVQKKLKEIGNNLKFDSKAKQKIKNMFLNYGKIMKDETIPYAEREKTEKEFFKELDLFRKNISSFLTELDLEILFLL